MIVPSTQAALSDTALEWIWTQAERQGLALDADYRRELVQANPLGKLHRSWAGMYRVKGRRRRPIGTLPRELERVHPSVQQRLEAMPGYRPGNLMAYLGQRDEAS